MLTTFALSTMVVSNHAEVVWCFCFLNISKRELYFFTVLPWCFENEGLAFKLVDCYFLKICHSWLFCVATACSLPVSAFALPGPLPQTTAVCCGDKRTCALEMDLRCECECKRLSVAVCWPDHELATWPERFFAWGQPFSLPPPANPVTFWGGLLMLYMYLHKMPRIHP